MNAIFAQICGHSSRTIG